MTIEHVLLRITVHVLPSVSLKMLIMMHIKSIVHITGTHARCCLDYEYSNRCNVPSVQQSICSSTVHLS
jgi:hypothetical protein